MANNKEDNNKATVRSRPPGYYTYEVSKGMDPQPQPKRTTLWESIKHFFFATVLGNK